MNIPVGPGVPPVTVAVKETVCPGVDGFGEEVKLVVVAKAWTFCTRVALAAGKLVSPL